MASEDLLRIAVVAGEESGDLLGADLVTALRKMAQQEVELVGVGGHNLEKLGLNSLFNADEIALMGISAVVRDLPRLILRIGQTARSIVAARPDCLVTIDSPDFSLRVAKKVRAADPTIPIVHYVSPSVWAWRPGRAPAMRPYIDNILCLLPFEPRELELLGGPPGTFVGHRLAADPSLLAAAEAQQAQPLRRGKGPRKLLVLPGSRKGEVRSLLGPFGETVRLLTEREGPLEVLMPTVPHVASIVEERTADWIEKPRIILDGQSKWKAFAEADAALACSGTVALELALARVPFVVCYKTDFAARALIGLITSWSASLPNLIADWPIVPEHFNEFIRPPYLARQLGQLMKDTPARKAQLDGFAQVAAALSTTQASGDIAAKVVLRHIRKGMSAKG
ncbi:lipid-A-disaccharide synthase [Mesorhizobium sp. J18]|uniref:lipid-A-disaccharide synthase n=1 Tax=Mesorhizobium sp. J18 TaxID=935263 RepID=UPI0011991626|nr:lipid-A-disaccharide synthase [Mesorhizobium sp. J18]TWG99101.1 lipid-A-disaccharide synthase [Mesorhizobium sp. J18]